QWISEDTFRLGCTPVVNLYPQRAEPIRLTHTDYEYRVVPDARRLLAHEVYTINRVTASSDDGEQAEVFPFFSVKHGSDRAETFWHASRRPAERDEGQGRGTGGAPVAADRGTEVFLSLVDLNLKPAAQGLSGGTETGDWTLDIQTTCF